MSLLNSDLIFKRVLSISLTSSRQNCNLTKDFTFISSQHVSSSSLLFTWWFKNDRQYFPKNKRCRNPLSPESESGDKRLVIWVLKTGPQWGFSSLGQPGHLSPPPNLPVWFHCRFCLSGTICDEICSWTPLPPLFHFSPIFTWPHPPNLAVFHRRSCLGRV